MGRRRADFAVSPRLSTDSLRRQELEQVISADVVFAQEFVMVKLTQLGEQDKADGKRGKTGGLHWQPKFGGGVQQQEGDGDVFINDIWNKNRVFQTAFFKGFRAQKEY